MFPLALQLIIVLLLWLGEGVDPFVLSKARLVQSTTLTHPIDALLYL